MPMMPLEWNEEVLRKVGACYARDRSHYLIREDVHLDYILNQKPIYFFYTFISFWTLFFANNLFFIYFE